MYRIYPKTALNLPTQVTFHVIGSVEITLGHDEMQSLYSDKRPC